MGARKDHKFEFELIEAIRVRPLLYDQNNPQNKDIVLKAVAWKEIAKVCGESAERCLSRWKSLRDRYLREYKMRRDTNKKIKWTYFGALSFLEKHLKTIASGSDRRVGLSGPSTSSLVSTNNDSIDQMEHEHDYSNESSQIKEESIVINNSSTESLRVEKHRIKRHNLEREAIGGTNNGNDFNNEDILEEPEIEFDIVGVVNRFNNTIDTFKEFEKLRTQKTEDENFGILVADMLSTLTVERRTRAKAHLMQYLAELHLQQISQ